VLLNVLDTEMYQKAAWVR